MKLQEVFSLKTTKYAIGAVILGALGSGLWQWGIKPLLALLSHIGLFIATLGMTAFKNSLYGDIAKGFHETPSLDIYVTLFSFIPSALLGVIFGVIISIKVINKTTDESLPYEESTAYKIANKSIRPLLVIIMFLLTFSIIRATETIYINNAVTHYQQLLSITSPYTTSKQKLILESKFSQISSSKDYKQVITTLNTICKMRSLKCPSFSIW